MTTPKCNAAQWKVLYVFLAENIVAIMINKRRLKDNQYDFQYKWTHLLQIAGGCVGGPKDLDSDGAQDLFRCEPQYNKHFHH